MTGRSRRTGKIAGVRQLSSLLRIAPPTTAGGTIPKEWLEEVLDKSYGSTAIQGAQSKEELLRRAIEFAGGEWSPQFTSRVGSTITGEGIWYLYDLLSSQETIVKQTDEHVSKGSSLSTSSSREVMSDASGEWDSAIDQFQQLLGVTEPNGLERVIRTKLKDEEPVVQKPQLASLFKLLATQEGIPWPKDGIVPSQQALAHIGAVLDERVAMMLSIWSHVGKTPVPPLSHDQFLARVHEDDRFVSKSPPHDLAETILAIAQIYDDGVTKDDLEELIADGQPTLFCYELIESYLEDCVSRTTSRAAPTVAREDDIESESEEDDDQDAEAFDAIEAQVKNYSVKSLFELVEAERLDLQPPWQRKDVWSLRKKRELIKSLLVGIPLPSIILHRQGSAISIIDGKQRLTSIVQFMRNEFKLPNFDVPSSHRLEACRGAWFKKDGKKSVPESVRTDLELREVPALLFVGVSESNLRRIFHLYNVSGTRLNAAEIRNAVYQRNPIHRMAYVLAGEARPTPDLETGDYEGQLAFTERLRATLPRSSRYAAVAFLSRYLGYSRAAQKDPSKPFRAASTSAIINRYFDCASGEENPAEVATEIMRVFVAAERFFDIDDERVPFHRRDDSGNRKFNTLIATSNLIAARFLIALTDANVIDDETAAQAARDVAVEYPANQQTATIWDYQAKLLLGLRDRLQVDVERLNGRWRTFFQRMEYARLPDPEEGA